MRVDSEFLNHSLLIRIEGFEQQRLLSSCIREGIKLREIRVENEISMTLRVSSGDFSRVKRLAGNRCRITVLGEKGIQPLLSRLFVRRSTLAGILIFAALMVYQGSFVSEIRIYGYESLREAELRTALRELGLYEGARKTPELDRIEGAMYGRLDNLSWIGIKYIGNMAEVTVVESGHAPEEKDTDGYTHVVAEKEGYIERVLPKNGLRTMEKGAYVKPGDVVITGLMPIVDKTYENREGQFHPVHAEGEVWARILYRFTCYQNRYELLKQPTGRHLYGISLEIGDLHLDSSDFLWPFDSAVREERNVFRCIRPFPVRLAVSKVSEVELYRRERTGEEIEKLGAAESRRLVKENVPENARILNNSLKFSAKENIIEVSITLHALEEIGKEQPFTYETTPSGIKEDTGGTDTVGQSTE